MPTVPTLDSSMESSMESDAEAWAYLTSQEFQNILIFEDLSPISPISPIEHENTVVRTEDIEFDFVRTFLTAFPDISDV